MIALQEYAIISVILAVLVCTGAYEEDEGSLDKQIEGFLGEKTCLDSRCNEHQTLVTQAAVVCGQEEADSPTNEQIVYYQSLSSSSRYIDGKLTPSWGFRYRVDLRWIFKDSLYRVPRLFTRCIVGMFRDVGGTITVTANTSTWKKLNDAEATPPKSCSSSLRIASYNIFNFNSEFEYRMRAIAMQMMSQNVDVIAFQEVRFSTIQHPTRRKGSQLDDLLSRMPGYQYVYECAHVEFPYGQVNRHHTEEGVAILSRFPIVEWKRLLLSRNSSDSEDAHQRVVLAATVNTPGGNISILTTHFSLSDAARRRNVVELARFASDHVQRPHVILGDFNAEPDSVEMKFLRGEVMLNGSLLSEPYIDAFYGHSVSSAWTFTTHHPQPKKRIDFVYLSPSTTPSTQSSVKLRLNRPWILEYDKDDYEYYYGPPSDHRPVLVEILLEDTRDSNHSEL